MRLADSADIRARPIVAFPHYPSNASLIPASEPRPLRTILLHAGESTLDDQDLLTLLFSAIETPGRARRLARTVLSTYPTTSRAIAAPPDRLSRMPDLTSDHVALMKTVEALATRHARASLPDDLSPTLDSYTRLIDYCRTLTGHRTIEEFHLLHLDAKNRLILDELHQHGTISHTPVYAREVCLRALDTGASAMIVFHNHPSNITEPSRADVTTTERLRDALKLIDVTLHDHLILAPSEAFSFREKGLL